VEVARPFLLRHGQTDPGLNYTDKNWRRLVNSAANVERILAWKKIVNDFFIWHQSNSIIQGYYSEDQNFMVTINVTSEFLTDTRYGGTSL